jgi:hypothetical protein
VALEDFMPLVLTTVETAAGAWPVYPYLPDGGPFQIPSILIFPAEGEWTWPRGNGGSYEVLTHTVDLHALFSVATKPVSDQDARAIIEPIRAGFALLTKAQWQRPVPAGASTIRSTVVMAGPRSYRRSVLTWGGVDYFAITLSIRVVEHYIDPRVTPQAP